MANQSARWSKQAGACEQKSFWMEEINDQRERERAMKDRHDRLQFYNTQTLHTELHELRTRFAEMEEQPKCKQVHKKKHNPFFPDIQHHRGQLRDAGHNYHLTQGEVYSHLTDLNDVAALLGSAGLRRPWSHIHCDCIN